MSSKTGRLSTGAIIIIITFSTIFLPLFFTTSVPAQNQQVEVTLYINEPSDYSYFNSNFLIQWSLESNVTINSFNSYISISTNLSQGEWHLIEGSFEWNTARDSYEVDITDLQDDVEYYFKVTAFKAMDTSFNTSDIVGPIIIDREPPDGTEGWFNFTGSVNISGKEVFGSNIIINYGGFEDNISEVYYTAYLNENYDMGLPLDGVPHGNHYTVEVNISSMCKRYEYFSGPVTLEIHVSDAATNCLEYQFVINVDTTPPLNISKPRAVTNSNDSVHLSWNATTDHPIAGVSPQGCGIAYYEIYRTSSSYEPFNIIGTTNITEFVDTNDSFGFNRGESYSYYIKAVDNLGNRYDFMDFSSLGNMVTKVQINLLPSVPELASPSQLTTVPRDLPIELRWNASSDPEGKTLNYLLEISDRQDFSHIVFSNNTTSLFCIVSNLTSGTTYYWRVNSFDGEDWSGYSNTSSFRTNGNLPVVYIVSPKNGTTINKNSITVSCIINDEDNDPVIIHLWVNNSMGIPVLRENLTSGNITLNLPEFDTYTILMIPDDGIQYGNPVNITITTTPVTRTRYIIAAIIIIAVIAAVSIALVVYYLKTRPSIEDIFLVYEDGRLIYHTTRSLKPRSDSDIVSSMLTAIQSFVKDTYKSEEGALNSVKFGELTILIEHKEKLFRAVVIRGKENANLRKNMKTSLDGVWLENEKILSEWSGDASEVKNIKQHLAVFLK